MTNLPALSESTLPRPRTDDEIGDAVDAFKSALLGHGYEIANGPRELANPDRTVWVSTTFTHGECRVYLFRRPRGYGNPEGHCYLVFGQFTDPARLDELAGWLARWVGEPPTKKKHRWPAPHTVPVR